MNCRMNCRVNEWMNDAHFALVLRRVPLLILMFPGWRLLSASTIEDVMPLMMVSKFSLMKPNDETS